MTTPLGWLKRNQQAFTPALPGRFSSAINSIGYGSLEKVVTTPDTLHNESCVPSS